MEVQPRSWIFFLWFLLLFLIILKRVPSLRKARPRLPPGPQKLPIIGNMHHLRGSPPHRLFQDLARKYGPLMHFQFGQISLVVVSSPELAREIMKTSEALFAQRPRVLGAAIITYGGKNIVNAPYGDYWRQLRKICLQELLSAKRVESFRRLREEEVSNFVGRVSSVAGEAVNLSEMVFVLTADVTALTVFGRRCRDGREFKKAMDEAIRLRGGFDVADMFPSSKVVRWLSGSEGRFRRVHERLDRIVSELVDSHRGRRRKKVGEEEEEEEDLVDVLLGLEEHGNLDFQLPFDSIKAVILDMFAAGTDTSATAMEWALSQLLKNPRVMQKAQAEVRNVMKGRSRMTEDIVNELHYLKLVIKETFRLNPPIPLLPPREAMEAFELEGCLIPKKSRVQINCWAIGRDPKHWENPEEFRPERFENSPIDFKGQNFELLPFGAGRRGCPGISFAMAIIELVIGSLVYHFDWRLPDGQRPEDLDMSEGSGVAMIRKNNLYAVPTLYTV